MRLTLDEVTILRRVQARLEAHLELLENTDAPAVLLIEEEVVLVRELLVESERDHG